MSGFLATAGDWRAVVLLLQVILVVLDIPTADYRRMNAKKIANDLLAAAGE